MNDEAPASGPIQKIDTFDSVLGPGGTHEAWKDGWSLAGEYLKSAAEIKDPDKLLAFTKRERLSLRIAIRAVMSSAFTFSAVHKKKREALEARVAALESRQMKYSGVWTPERGYVAGEFVTDQGSVWHCNAPCVGVRPSADHETWTLAVKKGKDGR